MGGSKGILVLSQQLPPGCSIQVRNSQLKFVSSNRTCHVVSASRALPAYLSRQLVTLLQVETPKTPKSPKALTSAAHSCAQVCR